MTRLVVGENDLATTNPETAKEWDYENNGELKPTDITKGSNKKVWWVCKEGHSYQASPASRAIRGTGCPYCCGYKPVNGETDLATTNPDIVKEWDYNKNGNLKPQDVKSGSAKMAWWICPVGHSYKRSICSRGLQGGGCFYCSGSKCLTGFNDFATLHPEMLPEWDYNKNDISPCDTLSTYSKKVWWICREGHSYDASLSSRIANKSGCPYCAGIKILAGYNDFATLHPEMLPEWDYEKNGDLTPQMLGISGRMNSAYQKIWWVCKKGHSYASSICHRLSGQGCPYCVNYKILTGYNDLTTTNPEFAKEWDYEKNGDFLPQNIGRGSRRKVWWKCTRGHSWYVNPASRAAHNTGCPYCAAIRGASTPEKLVFFYIDLAFGDKYQVIPNDRDFLEDGTELDVFIPQLKIAVEYDGLRSHGEKLKKEIIKNDICKQKGINLIRIRERGLKELDNCPCCIMRESSSDEELDECISAMFDYILTITSEQIYQDVYSYGGEDDFINSKRDKAEAARLRNEM